MALTQDKAIELARRFLNQASKGHRILSAYLFGSYARGGQRDYSDIDLALVISPKSKKFYEETFDIFHEAQELNPLLEVICFKEDEFDIDGALIVRQIKKEGIEIEFS